MADKLKELIGIDARPKIRAAMDELRKTYDDGRRIADLGVDKVVDEAPLEIPLMAIQQPSGRWRIETQKDDCFRGQRGIIEVTDANEQLALVEFRFKLAQELAVSGFCPHQKARGYAAKAKLTVHGRIPYVRIQSVVK